MTAAAFDGSVDRVREIYRRLLRAYGPQHWWPADSSFEVIVGALLMQQTAWRNVEVALDRLKTSGLLQVEALAGARVDTIRAHVRSAGLYRTKPARLQAFCRHIVERAGGDLPRYFDRPTEVVRGDLLDQPGIGPETADSILLYAGGHPVFVVDAYTTRIAGRIGLTKAREYARVQRRFQRSFPREVGVYREYHALLVRHAKEVCRPRPRCDACAIRSLCDLGRARKPDARRRRSGDP